MAGEARQRMRRVGSAADTPRSATVLAGYEILGEDQTGAVLARDRSGSLRIVRAAAGGPAETLHIPPDFPSGEPEFVLGYDLESRAEPHNFASPHVRSANEHFQRAVAVGHGRAAAHFGRNCARGWGITIDLEEAERHLRRAVECGVAAAAQDLAALHGKAHGPNDAKAKLEYEALLDFARLLNQLQRGDAVDPYRDHRLATARLLGFLGEPDLAEGECLFAQATADQTDRDRCARAHWMLGRLRWVGLGMRQDRVAALQSLHRAMELGSKDAAFRLAELYGSGEEGVAKNISSALACFEAAAGLGAPEAYYRAARLLHDDSVAPDLPRAIEYYARAGAAGFASGYHAAARIYWANKQDPEARSRALSYAALAEKGAHFGSPSLAQMQAEAAELERREKYRASSPSTRFRMDLARVAAWLDMRQKRTYAVGLSGAFDFFAPVGVVGILLLIAGFGLYALALQFSEAPEWPFFVIAAGLFGILVWIVLSVGSAALQYAFATVPWRVGLVTILLAPVLGWASVVAFGVAVDQFDAWQARTARAEALALLKDGHRRLDAGDATGALAFFAEARALRSDAVVLSALGHAYVAAKRYGEAIDAYGQAVALDASHVGAHFGRGWTYWFVGRPKEALADYLRALELDPSNYVLHQEIERVYYELKNPAGVARLWLDARGRFKAGSTEAKYVQVKYIRALEADEDWSALRTEIPKMLGTREYENEPHYHYLMGRALNDAKQHQRAVPFARKAVQGVCGEPQAKRNLQLLDRYLEELAYTHLWAGNRQDAAKWHQQRGSLDAACG